MAVYPLYVSRTPYSATDIFDLDYAQAFDTIFLTHNYYPPAKLVRFDHDDWKHNVIAFGPEIEAPANVSAVATTPNTDAANAGASYFPQQYSYIVAAVDKDGKESRGSASASAANDTELPRNYTTISWQASAGDVDFYKIYKAHETGNSGFIGSTTGLSFVDDGIEPNYADAPVKAFNPFSGAGNYPARCGFWEQRLWFGNTQNNPSLILASRSADFENMDYSNPQRESDSITFAIASGQSNYIREFIAMDRLIVGTSDNVFMLTGPNDDVLVPNPPPSARRQIGRGIELPKPIMVGEVVFYQPRVETGLRTIGFTFEIEGYRSSDISIFAPHLFTNNRVIKMSYQAEPHSTLWVVRDDGALLAFTWEIEQQVWGWSEIDVGGKVIDVLSIPEGEEHRVYLCVERFINNETVRYIERMESAKFVDYQITSFVDCGRKFFFEQPTRDVGGLEHLEGEEVAILADGFATKAVVTNGAITVTDSASTFIIGLPYSVVIETLPLPQEEKKKITGEIYMELVDSFDVYAGRREDELELVRTRELGSIGAPKMFTGQPVPVHPAQVVDHQATIIVKQSTPYPFTLTALHYGVEAKGRP